MDLREYLFRNRMKASDLAKKIGYGRGYIVEVANGTKNPGKKLAKMIEQATEGQVTAEELLKDRKEQSTQND